MISAKKTIKKEPNLWLGIAQCFILCIALYGTWTFTMNEAESVTVITTYNEQFYKPCPYFIRTLVYNENGDVGWFYKINTSIEMPEHTSAYIENGGCKFVTEEYS